MDELTETDIILLTEIADDYESFPHVASNLMRDHGALLEELQESLFRLLRRGMAQAYKLNPYPPHSSPVPTSEVKLSEHWFWITQLGRDALKRAVTG